MLTAEYARILLRFLRYRFLTRAGAAGGPTGWSSSARAAAPDRQAGEIRFGRFVWVGAGTKIRCHEGVVEIGAKTVIGQEVTISAYQRVRIGEQCVIADRAMFIDFDHVVVDPETPIRLQGIYKRDVVVGSNVWIGYGAGSSAASPSATTRDRRQLGRHARHPGERRRRRDPGSGGPDAPRPGTAPLARPGRASGVGAERSPDQASCAPRCAPVEPA